MIADILCGRKMWPVFNIGNLQHFIIHEKVGQIKQKSMIV